MHEQFLILAIIWLVVLTVLMIYLWRRRHQTVGVTATYLIFLTAGYWFQGFTYALPWHEPAYDPALILAGFSQSVVGLLSFAFGVLIVVPFLRSLNRKFSSRTANSAVLVEESVKDNSRLTAIYIIVGLGTYLLVSRILGDIPTVGAFLGGVQRLYHVGILFLIWSTLKDGHPKIRSLILIGVLIILWPFLTISRDGFLGFGLIPTTLLLVFIGFRFMKWKTLLITAPIALYIGLSVVMTYFGERNTIRSVAWSGADTETRVTTVVDIFTNDFRPFNIFDPEQLAVFDIRFSLNWFTGRGIERLSSNLVDYAYGETIRDAFLMIIPRAIWPDKPIVAGGQATLNRYTGIYFYGATSAALGQVLEFYVNFGVLGVISAFTIIGIVLTLIDSRASNLMRSADFMGVAVWMAPMFNIFQDGLVDVVGGVFSTLFSVIIFNQFLIVAFRSNQRKFSSSRSSTANRAESPIVA